MQSNKSIIRDGRVILVRDSRGRIIRTFNRWGVMLIHSVKYAGNTTIVKRLCLDNTRSTFTRKRYGEYHRSDRGGYNAPVQYLTIDQTNGDLIWMDKYNDLMCWGNKYWGPLNSPHFVVWLNELRYGHGYIFDFGHDYRHGQCGYGLGRGYGHSGYGHRPN